MSREEKTTKMLAMVDQFRASGMTQEQFVNDHGIAISVLRYWLAKSRQESNGPGFIQLDGIIQQEFRIVYPNGIEIHVPAQTPMAVLQQLIQF
jgi:hypothetical protein